MGNLQKSGLIRRKPLPRGVSINKKGPLTTLWEDFRGKKLVKDRDEDGLILCQDWKLELPPCGQRVSSPDLHHILGREARPDLYFANKNLAWLVRNCHDEAHKLSKSGIVNANDKIRSVDNPAVGTLQTKQKRVEDGSLLQFSRTVGTRTPNEERV